MNGVRHKSTEEQGTDYGDERRNRARRCRVQKAGQHSAEPHEDSWTSGRKREWQQLEQKRKIIVRTEDPAQHGKLTEVPDASETAKIETLEKTDKK